MVDSDRSSSKAQPGDQLCCKFLSVTWAMGSAARGGSRAHFGEQQALSHSKLEGDVREGEREVLKEAGQAGPLLGVWTQNCSLGRLQVCQSRLVVQSPLAALLRDSESWGAPCFLALRPAALLPTGDLWVTVESLVNGWQRGLLAETLAQAHEQRLRHGRDIHIVAEVYPSQARELVHVLHGVSQLLHGCSRQSVAVEGKVGELGQHPEEGQQQAHHVVVQLGEAQVHGGEVVPVVLKVVRHAVHIPHGQRDPGQIHGALAHLLLQAVLQAGGGKGERGMTRTEQGRAR